MEHAQAGSLQFAMNKVSTHQPTQDLCLYKIMNEVRIRWHVHRKQGCTLAESGRISLGTCNLVTPRELKLSLLHPPSTQSHVTSDLYKESLSDTKPLSALLIATTSIQYEARDNTESLV